MKTWNVEADLKTLNVSTAQRARRFSGNSGSRKPSMMGQDSKAKHLRELMLREQTKARDLLHKRGGQEAQWQRTHMPPTKTHFEKSVTHNNYRPSGNVSGVWTA